MNDPELFELCKLVYEATGWDGTIGFINNKGSMTNDEPRWYDETICEDLNIAPLYTSDYLLEKLPKYIKHRTGGLRFELVPQGYDTKGADKWCAAYVSNEEFIYYLQADDVPLKALLKLTLALTDAGILKADNKKAA